MARLKEKRLSCSKCDKKFPTKEALKKHRQTHAGEKSHKCKECQKSFPHQYLLQKHMFSHTGETQHVCTDCSRGFPDAQSLKNHSWTHTGQKAHSCSVCGKGFTQSSSLNLHMKIHTGEKPYSCDVCDYSSCRKDSLEVHKLLHTGERPHVCSECGKGFTRPTYLKQHIATTHGTQTVEEKNFACPQCDKKFSTEEKQMRHIESHTLGKSHKCTECDKCFTHQYSLKKHKLMHTGETPHLCAECGKGFLDARTLKHHMHTHTGEKPYVCSECGKGFSQSSSLNLHKKIHTGQKPYLCDVCGYSSSRKESLEVHKLLHTGVRPHVCSECGKGFTRVTYLKEHIETHHTVHAVERRFACPLCDKRFRTKKVLRHHIKTHTSTKDHICPLCNKGFARHYSLERHMVRHTGERPYQCLLCGHTFTQDGPLFSHIRKDHPEMIPQLTSTENRQKLFVYTKPDRSNLKAELDKAKTLEATNSHTSNQPTDIKHPVISGNTQHTLPISKDSVYSGNSVTTGSSFNNDLHAASNFKTNFNPHQTFIPPQTSLTHNEPHMYAFNVADNIYAAGTYAWDYTQLYSSVQSVHNEIEQYHSNQLPPSVNTQMVNPYPVQECTDTSKLTNSLDSSKAVVSCTQEQRSNDCQQPSTSSLPDLSATDNKQPLDQSSTKPLESPKQDEELSESMSVMSNSNYSDDTIDYVESSDASEEYVPRPTTKRAKVSSESDNELTNNRKTERKSTRSPEETETTKKIPKAKNAKKLGGKVKKKKIKLTDDMGVKKKPRRRHKKHLCEVCGLGCSSSGAVKVHMRVHTGEKPHICPECGKGFAQTSSLHGHRKRVHSDVRDFVCEDCGKAFKTKPILDGHKIYHQEKSFVCSYCDKPFYKVHHLKRHIVQHTGDRPYRCLLCSRTFTQSGPLYTHIRKDHPECVPEFEPNKEKFYEHTMAAISIKGDA